MIYHLFQLYCTKHVFCVFFQYLFFFSYIFLLKAWYRIICRVDKMVADSVHVLCNLPYTNNKPVKINLANLMSKTKYWKKCIIFFSMQIHIVLNFSCKQQKSAFAFLFLGFVSFLVSFLKIFPEKWFSNYELHYQ